MKNDADIAEIQILDSKIMQRYAENNIDCRRYQLLAPFGQKFDIAHCNKIPGAHCDNCSHVPEMEDVTEFAVTILQLLNKLEATLPKRNYTIEMIVAILKGSLNKKTKLIESEHHGILKHFTKLEVFRLLGILIDKKIINEYYVHSSVLPIQYIRSGRDIGANEVIQLRKHTEKKSSAGDGGGGGAGTGASAGASAGAAVATVKSIDKNSIFSLVDMYKDVDSDMYRTYDLRTGTNTVGRELSTEDPIDILVTPQCVSRGIHCTLHVANNQLVIQSEKYISVNEEIFPRGNTLNLNGGDYFGLGCHIDPETIGNEKCCVFLVSEKDDNILADTSESSSDEHSSISEYNQSDENEWHDMDPYATQVFVSNREKHHKKSDFESEKPLPFTFDPMIERKVDQYDSDDDDDNFEFKKPASVNLKSSNQQQPVHRIKDNSSRMNDNIMPRFYDRSTASATITSARTVNDQIDKYMSATQT